MYGVHHRQSPFALLIQLFQLFYNLLNVSVGAAGLVAIKEEFQYNNFEFSSSKKFKNLKKNFRRFIDYFFNSEG